MMDTSLSINCGPWFNRECLETYPPCWMDTLRLPLGHNSVRLRFAYAGHVFRGTIASLASTNSELSRYLC